MRTLKTLAALGALVLIASSANASLIFTVHASTPGDNDAQQSFQVDLSLSAGQTLDLFGFNWTYTSGTPVGGPPSTTCNFADPQTMCSFGGVTLMAPVGGQATGVNWVWDSSAAGPTGPANFTNIAQFTLSGLANGTTISLGAIEAFDANNLTITDIQVIPYTVTVVPEPTTVALIGLGLAGLGLAGRRKA